MNVRYSVATVYHIDILKLITVYHSVRSDLTLNPTMPPIAAILVHTRLTHESQNAIQREYIFARKRFEGGSNEGEKRHKRCEQCV